MEFNMIRIITVLLVLFSTSAMAGQIQGQISNNKAVSYTQQDVTVLGDNTTKRMVKAPHAPSIALFSNYRWPCGGVLGGGVQGQFAGFTGTATKDSKNCIAWMLAMQERSPELKQAYLCQMKVHRKAMASVGRPCVKARKIVKPVSRPTYR